KVILNNDGLVKNGTAANLAYDNGLDVSALYQKSISERSFLKFGFNTKIKNSAGEIFSRGKFKNDFGFTMGFTGIIGKPGRFFDNSKCATLQEERRAEERDLKIKFNDLAIINQDTLIANIKKYKKLSTVVIGVPNPNYAKY